MTKRRVQSLLTSSGATNGTAAGLNVVIVWTVWKIFGLDIPNEVAISATALAATFFQWLAKQIEYRQQIKIKGENNG